MSSRQRRKLTAAEYNKDYEASQTKQPTPDEVLDAMIEVSSNLPLPEGTVVITDSGAHIVVNGVLVAQQLYDTKEEKV